MRITAVGVFALLGVLISVSPSGTAARPAPGMARLQATTSPALLFVKAGHLWLRSLVKGSTRMIATPWPPAESESVASDIEWAPDMRRIAFDDGRSRLAVINLATGHATMLIGRHCSGSCQPPIAAWSPNARYLAFVRPVGNGEQGVLRLWDSHTGTTRTLMTNVAFGFGYPGWSHDSTRIAIEAGKTDFVKSIFPQVVVISLTGHTVALGKGTYVTWSGDDHFVGIIRPNFCGANTCDEDELVRVSTGGPAIVLAKHTTNLFDNPVWAPQPYTYAFDRWILNSSGQPVHRLAGPHERVVSWQPNGLLLALQTYYPYQGTPDVLYVSTPLGQRRRVYTDGPNAGCGACSKGTYDVVWGQGQSFAFATPGYPTPKNVMVQPKFFVSTGAGKPLAQINIPHRESAYILGIISNGNRVILAAGKSVYGYDIGSRRLSVIVSGLTSGLTNAMLDPKSGRPDSLLEPR